MLTFNEGKVCEAIIRHLEAREGKARVDVQSPESTNHAYPVELTWKLGNQWYALEHTGIEPFDDHISLEAKAKTHFDPIRDALKDLLPSDVIELHVPAKAMFGLKKASVELIQKAIIEWARQAAPKLKIRSYTDYIGDIQSTEIPNVPFGIRLYRFENISRQKGGVRIVHFVAGDAKQQRRERLRRACEKKFPKLYAWKQKCNARTILVLEANDIQLTNQALVAEAYLPLALDRTDRPDETYLIFSCTEPWILWHILIDNNTLYDLRIDGHVQRWEIDPAALPSATMR